MTGKLAQYPRISILAPSLTCVAMGLLLAAHGLNAIGIGAMILLVVAAAQVNYTHYAIVRALTLPPATAEAADESPVAESQTLTVSIRCPLDRAYGVLANPASWPQWAAGLGESIEKEGDHWIVQTPGGSAQLRVTPWNRFGVLDHVVRLPDGTGAAVPMRLVQNGAGCEAILTIFRLPGMSDEQFQQDIEAVRRDLQALQECLERGAARA